MNLPDEFTERLKKQFGESYSELVELFQQPSPVSIRINPKKPKTVTGEKIPWTEEGYYLDKRPSFTFDPLFHAGTYYVQEASSMFVEQIFRQLTVTDEPLVVLDLCAAPGGKSTHIASLLNEKSILISNEVINSRSKILTENIVKWGYGNTVVSNNDPEDFCRYKNLFDIILVDAPCSGEGLFRKDKDAVTEWSSGNTHLCSVRQRRILNDIIPCLKPGGLLIYATCTFNPEENENNITWLCKEYPVECLQLNLKSDWRIEERKNGKCISYHLYPHRVKGEGFFISVLKNASNESDFILKPSKQKTYSQLKKEFTFTGDWIIPDKEKMLLQYNSIIKLLPSRHLDLIESLQTNLKILSTGIDIGEIKNKEVIPSHSLAMYAGINKSAFDCIELSEKEALKYLRKEEILIPSAVTGWKLMTYRQIPLGWIKHLGKRINNYYPSEWRIRKSG